MTISSHFLPARLSY